MSEPVGKDYSSRSVFGDTILTIPPSQSDTFFFTVTIYRADLQKKLKCEKVYQCDDGCQVMAKSYIILVQVS